MAGPENEPQPRVAHLTQVGDNIVTDVPRIDLESYISNYKGRTRVNRLLLIASTSTVLSVDALKLAIQEVKQNESDVQQYRNISEELRILAPNDPEARFDRQWADKVEKTNQQELIRLETELKGYKNNLIKESIRMGNEDLAKHLESTGELAQAYEVYAKMRSDVSSTKHIAEVGLHLARISIFRRDWAMAIANVNKISGLHVDSDDKSLKALCGILHGIGQLGQAKYKEAAHSFLQVEATLDPMLYDEFASPNDIATYGGLLALATMTRPELDRFLDASPFRTFLELEPHLRRAISQFVNGRYSACLTILESYRSEYLLDIYLQPHVQHLYSLIRAKCIRHFMQPFSCVTIDSMNAAFASPGASIEAELVEMIRHGGLEARIDSIEKLVTTANVNPRAKMQNACLKSTRTYEKDAIDRIRRIGILSADLEVKGKQRGPIGFDALDSPYGSSRFEADKEDPTGFADSLA